MTENERLTHSRMSGIFGGYWTSASKTELLNRLAEYENTGLMPDEVRVLANIRFADQHDPLAERMCYWLDAWCSLVDKDGPCSNCDYIGRSDGLVTIRVPADAVEDLRKYLGGRRR